MQALPAPLPDRDGVSPSYIWIPEIAPLPLHQFLAQQFPDVPASIWQERLAKQEVVTQTGEKLQADSIVRRGMCIFYYREVPAEPRIPFEEQILFQDEHLLVADKPHFLAVTPGGQYLRETLLVRLKQRTGLSQLTPLHRLDRETAGVILFSVNPATRGKYQAMFQAKTMQKTYHAVARHLPALETPCTRRSRITESPRFFVMEETAGEPNSETHLRVLHHEGEWALYELSPVTGKRHQLRIHMNALDCPILHDTFYPTALPAGSDDFAKPLQLLAKTIRFTDPLNGDLREFHSDQQLFLPQQNAENTATIDITPL